MDDKKKLVSVAGLRRADPIALQVLTQDVLRTPLARIEASTLVDLLALSELGTDQLPGSMVKELQRFRAQMFREMSDLPDGIALIGFADTLVPLAPATVPACLREVVEDLIPERKDPDTVLALKTLLERADSAPPEVVVLPSLPEKTSPNRAHVTKVAAVKAPANRTARSVEARVVEDTRGEWIEGDVLDRLKSYPSGLKEAVVVAGSRHRAPWQDLTEDDVLKVLRRLRREGRTRFSAGRWYPAS